MATPLNEGKSIAQKLHENLTWMRANGAPAEEQHAEIAKAQAALDRESAAEKESIGKPGIIQKGAEALVSGLPGAQRAVAGYRGALSLAGIGSETPDEALKSQRENVASLPASVRVPLQVAGSIPAAAALAPLGVAAGGGAFGAAMGADAPAEGISERARNMVGGTVLGAAGSKLLQLGGAGIANVANRTGLTDKMAGIVGKVSPKLGASMGTRGQINQTLSDREDILDAFGKGTPNAATKILDRIKQTKDRAGELYGVAKQDTGPIQDPRLQELLNDPQITKAMEAVSTIRSASGSPLPRDVAPATVPTALEKMGTTQARYTELLALAQKRKLGNTGVDILAPELKGEAARGLEIPDPDALSKLKRYLNDAAMGRQDSPLNIQQDEARALLPKVQRIREILHETSPAWKEADNFYADAKGQEEAFTHGFDAFRHANNPSGEQLPTNTAEAMMKEITEPRYPGEPRQAMARRVEAFRDGIRSAAAKGVQGAPVDRNLRSALNTPALAGDEETQAVRSLGFKDPDARAAMEQLISTQRGKAMGATGRGGVMENDLAYHGGRIRAAVRSLLNAPDQLATPAGQDMLQQRLGNRTMKMGEIDRMKAGESLQDYLARIATISGAGQLTRKNTP